MLVTHAAWDAGRLALWAEDTSRAAGPGASRARVRPHPFAAPQSALAAALPSWGDAAAEAAAKAVPGEVTLLLPGSASGPLPSPETGLSVAARRPGIRAWRVPALLVDAGPALRLLTTLDEAARPPAESPEPGDRPGDVPADVLAGPSVRYLAVVAGQVRDLVRRGRVLPQLVAEDGGYAARWRPVLTGRDATCFRELAAAMPPVCRAVAEERPSAHVLIEAMATLTDAAVRQALPERLLGGHRPGRRSPLADRWTVALTGDAAALPGVGREEAETLARPLQEWFRSAHQLEGPVKVSFRLIEPETVERETAESAAPAAGARQDIAAEYDLAHADAAAAARADGGTWRLEFALQSSEDPSLYLPAPLLWAGETMPGLPGRADEALLTGLGRAARLYPKIDDALRQSRPAHVDLDVENAFHFLRHAAPLLQSAGFGVRLPAWAGRARLGLKLTARSRSGPGAAAGQGFGLEQLMDFRAELAVGDETISEEELAELARLKVPLVRLRGQWVELDAGRLDAALKAVERRGSGLTTVGEILREVVQGGDDDLPLVGVDADGPLGDLLSGEADRRLEPVATPAAFQGTLRPYQERGLAWLDFMSGLGLGGILADDMGLGKTAQTLSLLMKERESGERVEPTLLVCPMSLLSNWQKEAARFAPSLDAYLHHGTGRLRGEELAERVARTDLVLTTYGTASRDRDVLAGFTWARVVCDEAQAVKNAAARQSQAVRSLPARTRLALTGTPVENHLAELWSIMEFCNPGLLGSARAFRRRYQEPIERHGDETATAALRRATGPFVLRRLKTDKTIISDLPDKLEMKVWCTLTPEQASLYQAVVEDMMDRISGSEGIERRGNVLAAMAKLKQVCNHPAHLLKDGSRLAGRSGKLARLEELAEEIVSEGDKALVFTQYAEFGSMLQPYLAARVGRPVLWLHGGLPKKARDALVERFQSDDEPMLFLLSLKAAGTGLNLTAAAHVIHVDRWWNPAVEDQATDRAFRIGQTRNVQVRKFICTGTLEERIDEMIERKKALAGSVVGTGEEWLAELSTAELRELFRLSPEAVS
ncbi:DEAD/DEAH box helicase [Microbispora sp. H11081]|uniref:DEAD/DEAH box helicase n=1 Tax=Microbispora sp. H11081 TaxID=2729107 RepID=UPI0014750947|nr:DEAD/DEAH box helicase [Microbispora sp. H11081]